MTFANVVGFLAICLASVLAFDAISFETADDAIYVCALAIVVVWAYLVVADAEDAHAR
jgi:hypothetical protein